MAMRLVLDMAAAAGADELIPIASAHLSGVSPLTGGLGLRHFLARLASDTEARVAVPTTLNSAGCDETQFDSMHIVAPDFLAHNHEIVARYTQLGVQPTQSCIPYEWDGVVTSGTAAWAESNAICFGNSYCGLSTNRESGLSALAAALTGYTPRYGLLQEDIIWPNLHIIVSAPLEDPTDFSILGDWFGAQRKPHWRTPLGPIPLFSGLPDELNHEQRKALTAAAANYGCPKLYIAQDLAPDNPILLSLQNTSAVWAQDTLHFTQESLTTRYSELAPRTKPALIVLGCPQASVGELRAVAKTLHGKRVVSSPRRADAPLLWVFTSSANRAIAERTGIARTITEAGALLLVDTCPEVVPYDRSWVDSVLTNSMKAEHYIQSGLNGIPTAVMRLTDCVAIATNEHMIDSAEMPPSSVKSHAKQRPTQSNPRHFATGSFSANGSGLPSQGDYVVRGEAFATDTPITLLGFVNRETGVIEEPGHPADGESMAGKIAIFPKGSGSTVAPYVLLELYYRDRAPLAIVNTDIDQQTAPACSLENIPYAFSFDKDIIRNINSGDTVELRRTGQTVTISVIKRAVQPDQRQSP
jgi:predicted aconitase/predicted aconitase with swiveling domain